MHRSESFEAEDSRRDQANAGVLFAKRYMVESIYRAANVEGIGITFPETQTICDGMSVSNHSIDEIEAIVDLKKAWQWCFANSDADIDIKTLQTINRIAGKMTVLNAGSLRAAYSSPIFVNLRNGERYEPPLPDEEKIQETLQKIVKDGDKGSRQDAALNLFCFVAKGQFFSDGNKRTATILTNLYLMQHNLGVLSIPPDKKMDFYDRLTDYYADDGNKERLKKFLADECITAIKNDGRIKE